MSESSTTCYHFNSQISITITSQDNRLTDAINDSQNQGDDLIKSKSDNFKYLSPISSFDQKPRYRSTPNEISKHVKGMAELKLHRRRGSSSANHRLRNLFNQNPNEIYDESQRRKKTSRCNCIVF